MGLVIVYKATTVVNFAHGELFMVGGFLAYTFHVLLKLGYVVSLVLAVAAALLLGLVTERLAYRPLTRAPAISLVLAAVGFSFVLKGAARQIWGGLGDYIPFPPLVATPAITLGGLILVLLGDLARGFIHTSFPGLSAFLVIMVVLVVRPPGFFGPRAVRRI